MRLHWSEGDSPLYQVADIPDRKGYFRITPSEDFPGQVELTIIRTATEGRQRAVHVRFFGRYDEVTTLQAHAELLLMSPVTMSEYGL